MSISQTKKGTKRYNLVIPSELYEEVAQVAQERHTTLVDMIRRFVRLGLLAAKLQDSPDEGVYVRKGGTEYKVSLF